VLTKVGNLPNSKLNTQNSKLTIDTPFLKIYSGFGGKQFFKAGRFGFEEIISLITNLSVQQMIYLQNLFKEILKVKLYRFRSLVDNTDYCRLKEILETRKFHCSRFPDLNDPMEGVYVSYYPKEIIDLIFKIKMGYKICSFSHEKEFSNPLLWGYYANGFRGVAVEVDVGAKEVRKIKYEPELPRMKGLVNEEKVEKILTTKLCPWSHECEYRFLTKNNGDKHEIGDITAVYFGDPYGITINKEDIITCGNKTQEYYSLRNDILKLLKGRIPAYSVKIENCEVVMGDIIPTPL
jgi:hypothetical protein